ncbi:hypothetical protein LSCM1_02228 [Leishmania martiniquensis]|uniref:Uncharacterized protein n=1 Tax=Leishmania martiniquensis TaxID=1580590 RepID=A0A836H0Q5_9TRYP|nr:hypothetical protein LSCM1_02228 [Leishmania martiniquensis]
MHQRVAAVVFFDYRRGRASLPLAHIHALHASLRWESNYSCRADGTTHARGPHVPSIPHLNLAEGAATQAKSYSAEAPTPHEHAINWSGGSAYYFSEEEMARIHAVVPRKALGGENAPPSAAAQSATRAKPGSTNAGEGEDSEASPTVAKIRGVARNFCIDLTIPPLRREEVERWSLDWYLFRRCYNATSSTVYSRKRSDYLLPPTAMVTYLGPQMRKIDQLHRQKGFMTPSEVAEVFIPLVPTYWVEGRHVMAAVPPEILRRLEKATRGALTLSQIVFEHYPMLFHYSPNRFRRALVRLNSQFWFVRQHPGYGKADRTLSPFRHRGGVEFDAASMREDEAGVEPLYAAWEKAASEGVLSLGGRATGVSHRRPWSVETLSVLVRNLPRVPTPKESSKDMASEHPPSPARGKPLVSERYRPLNLVSWINSFSPDDLAVVNRASQVSLVQLITQYVHVMQLMSLKKGDHNLFVEGHVLLSGCGDHGWKADTVTSRSSSASGSEREEKSGEASLGREASEEEDETTGWWSTDSVETPKGSGTAENTAESPAAGNATFTVNTRERAFKQALTEELIDLDSLVEERGGYATVFDSEADSTAFARGPDETAEIGSGRDVDEHSAYRNGGGDGDEDTTCLPHERGALPQLERQTAATIGEITAFGLPLEELYLRRLPPDVAPRSLSDLDETTSPDPELLAIAASFLASPPSLRLPGIDCFFRRSQRQLRRVLRPVDEIWRWVEVKRLYAAFTAEQRRRLRGRYKGLVGFLRYHGKIFELSSDLMYVIAHDPKGTMAPIPPMERAFRYANRVYLPDDFDDNSDRSASVVGEAERKNFTRALGEGSIPTSRRHLLLLDPDNPLMQHEVLYDEIVKLLPDHPVPMQDMLSRLPPVMRAALPHEVNMASSKSVDVFVERGRVMIRKKTAAQRSPAASASQPQMSVEDAIAELLQLPIAGEEITLKALVAMHLSPAAISTLSDHFGSVTRAVRMLPQYFEVWESDLSGRKKILMVRLRQ